jgi:hypothetical protein
MDEAAGGERSVTLWAADGLHVWARSVPGRGLEISGQDLRGAAFFGPGVSEYEYAFTISPADVPTVVAALGGDPGSDVLDVLASRGAELVKAGESRWLAAQGITPDFWSRVG